MATTTNFIVTEVGAEECQHVTFSIGTTGQFSFANVYMDSHDGSKRATLCNTLQEVLPIGTIIGGDFNMVQDLDLDTLLHELESGNRPAFALPDRKGLCHLLPQKDDLQRIQVVPSQEFYVAVFH